MFEKLTFVDGEVAVNLDSNSFMIQDLTGLVNVPIVEISKLFVLEEARKSGRGTFMLNSAINKYKETSIIVLKAEPLFETEAEYHACSNMDEQITKLVSFYERRGFVNINNYVGYENSVAMIYNNIHYRKIMDQLL